MTSMARKVGKVRAPRKIMANAQDGLGVEDEWTTLSSAFVSINNKNASSLSFEQLYRSAYKLVLGMRGADLYERVRGFMQDWLSRVVRGRLRDHMAGTILAGGSSALATATATERRETGEKFMRELDHAWSDHQMCTKMISDVLMYLNRTYCSDNRQPDTYVVGMALFRDHILRAPLAQHPDDTVLRILYAVILDQIQAERDGDVIDNMLIRSCTYALEGLYETYQEDENEKLYLTSFEPEFLRISRQYYAAVGDQLLRSTDAATYFRIADDRLRKESDRCKMTICELTSPKIQTVVEEELLARHFKEVLEMPSSGGQWMLDNDRVEDLLLVFDLNARIDPKKQHLVDVLQKRIGELGKDINDAAIAPKEKGRDEDFESKPANPAVLQMTVAITWMEGILALIDRFDRFWKQSFRSDAGLQTALNKSYENVINDFPKGPEFISLFLDENLKRGIRGKTEAEVDSVLEKAITLIRFIRDKDLFERYYKKHLARRLLLQRSVSEDVERQMISRMKVEVGNSFTQKLEGMFKDMSVSADLTNLFQRSMAVLETSERPDFDLSMNILTSTFWPEELTTVSKEGAALPPVTFHHSVDRAKEKFMRFYNSKHNGRKLMWQANMGSADVTVRFPAHNSLKERRYDLNVSTYGMMVLLLFNEVADSASLTFEEIQEATQISKEELARNLQSLGIAPKTRVLIKEPMSKDVKPGDRFFFNKSFHSKFVKIKIGVVAGSSKIEGEKERMFTHEKNDEHRGASIEAAVIRIMKQRKTLSHQNLVTEVIAQMSLRFKPDIGMIKKRIESLIEREYLERDEKADHPSYRYLA